MAKFDSCKWRARPMKARQRKLYCSEPCRWKAWATRIDDTQTSIPCFYCGAPADTVDHIPLRAYRQAVLADGHMKEKFPLEEVDACRECNSYLGASFPWIKKERKEKVKKYLNRRYRKFLTMPEWTPEEIQDLGRLLQDDIKVGMLVKEITKKRLAW